MQKAPERVGRKVTTRTKRGAEKGQAAAQRAQQSTFARVLPAAGLSARAVSYLLLGGITVEILRSTRGEQASTAGAFEEVVHQPGGPLLLFVLGIGLAAYAAWRLLQAAARHPRQGEATSLAKRVGYVAIGLVYLVLAVEALRQAVGGAGASSASSNTTPLSRTLLAHHGGQFLLGAIGTGIAAAGIGLLIWTGSQRFDGYLHLRERPKLVEMGGRIVETMGQGVRGALVAGIGISLVAAAVEDQPHDSRGLDTAIVSLASSSGTRWIVGVVAAGLFCFGLASIVEAVYREP